MKKIILSLLLVLFLVGCGESSGESNTLTVFSPSEYIDQEAISRFEKEYDVRVVFVTFESNEQMYTKLSSGDKYDVLVPSDYMIERLILEDKIQKLDFSKIKNYPGIIESLKGNSFDPSEEYAVPYFWGALGIAYDKTQVNETVLEEKGWDIFLDETYKGNNYFYDSERDAFLIALKALGYSGNTNNESEIEAGYNWLIKQKETMDPVYVMDEVIGGMERGSKALAVMYSGDASYVNSINENIEFFLPKEGTNIFVDAMVISKESTQVELAHKWIDFMISEEIAEMNSIAVGYSSVVESVYDSLKDTEFSGIDAYQPRLNYEKDEYFRYNETLRKEIAVLWERVKAQ